MRRLFNRQFILFIAGGLVSAIIDIGIMQIMIAAEFGYLKSATVGFFAGLIVNYSFHSTLTFKAISSFSIFVKFLSVVGINYLITVLFVTLSFSILGNAITGKLVSLPFITLIGFLLSKYWVFKR